MTFQLEGEHWGRLHGTKKCELDLMVRYRDYEMTMRNRQSKQMAEPEQGDRGRKA